MFMNVYINLRSQDQNIKVKYFQHQNEKANRTAFDITVKS